MTIVVGYASIMCLILFLFESEFDSGLNYVSLSSATNDYFEQHSSVLCQGICKSCTTSQCPSSCSRFSSFLVAWTSCLEVGYSVS
jgi:hypothetical protein